MVFGNGVWKIGERYCEEYFHISIGFREDMQKDIRSNAQLAKHKQPRRVEAV